MGLVRLPRLVEMCRVVVSSFPFVLPFRNTTKVQYSLYIRALREAVGMLGSNGFGKLARSQFEALEALRTRSSDSDERAIYRLSLAN